MYSSDGRRLDIQLVKLPINSCWFYTSIFWRKEITVATWRKVAWLGSLDSYQVASDLAADQKKLWPPVSPRAARQSGASRWDKNQQQRAHPSHPEFWKEWDYIYISSLELTALFIYKGKLVGKQSFPFLGCCLFFRGELLVSGRVTWINTV